MRTLLVNAYQEPVSTAGFYRHFLAPMPPITLAYLAAALEQAGLPVEVFEENGGRQGAADLESYLARARPDLVCLSAMTVTMPGVARVSRLVRRVLPEARIVMGNIHASVFHERILREGLADFVVHDEGERTLVELVRVLRDRSPAWSSVRGISFLEGASLVVTPPRPFEEDLDTIAFPAWHLFPLARYRMFNFARVREPAALVLGSRGCPYGCSYCSLKMMGTRRRQRSAANIADEFEYLHERFGYQQMSFTDAIFPLSKKEGLAFAAELIRRGLHRKVVWITETRTDLVDLELLEALRESGLRRIMFGFETGDERRLSTIRKGTGRDSGLEAARMARQAGVSVIGFFMLGIPGSSKKTLRSTIDYAKILDIDFAKFTVFCPYPGTAVHDELLAAGEIAEPDNWFRYVSYPTRETPPNYVPRGMTAQDLIRAQLQAHLTFYLRPRMVARHLFQLRTLKCEDGMLGARATWEGLGQILAERRRVPPGRTAGGL